MILPARTAATSRARRAATGLLWTMVVSGVLHVHAAGAGGTTGQAALPWREGERLAGRWEIVSIERHQEYIRLAFRSGAERTAVEIAPHRNDAGAWTTGRHLVQPAPAQSPPEALLREVLESLRAWEQNNAGGGPLVKPMEKGERRAVPTDQPRALQPGPGNPLIERLLVVLAFLIMAAAMTARDGRARLARTPVARPRRRGECLAAFALWCLVLAPLCAVTLVGVAAARRAHWINTRDERQIARSLDRLYATGAGEPFSFPTDGTRKWLRVEERGTLVPLARPSGGRIVYVFGESSLVIGDGPLFPEVLEQRLNPGAAGPFTVFNFGKSGAVSNSVANRVRAAIRELPPDLVVIYTGHNDYLSGYRSYNDRFAFFVANDPLLSWWLGLCYRAWLHVPFIAHPHGDHEDPSSIYREGFLRSFMEPWLLRELQRFHVVRFKRGTFDELNRSILSTYQRNLEAMLEEARSRGIPVVVSTLIGNLEGPSYGVGLDAERYQDAGFREPDPGRRLAYLTRARDADVFSGMPRAKSAMNQYLRSLEREGVLVLDLEGELKTRGFRFGDGDFIDNVHFSTRTHRAVGELIYEFLVGRRACCGLGAPSSTAGTPDDTAPTHR